MPHKLLLADDSVTIQRVIELTFADEDVQVQAVGDGMKAIASIQADRPDIVLADVGMPERDGYEVAAFIKGNPQLAHIPVLLLTGAFEPVDETRARAVGCDGVLVKPFEPQMVINRVKDLLAGRRTAPAPAPPPPAAAPRDSPASGASLEEYFDRLDAAFASLDGGTPGSASVPASQAGTGPALSPTDDFSGWDPDLTATPPGPAAPLPPARGLTAFDTAPPLAPPPSAPGGTFQAPPFVTPPPQVHTAPSIAPAPPAMPPPAAEPLQPVVAVPAVVPATAPSSAPLPSLAEAFAALLSAEQSRQVTPSTIGGPAAAVSDDVVEEVVRRVIARMGDSVLDAAERLVREEIERIKQA
jgi:CheY-like chemotaxis protein